MRLPVKPLISRGLRRSALVLLATSGIAVGTALAARERAPEAVPATGPAADYPVIVGAPFTIGGTVWTPSDQLNYDAVGLAGTDEAGLTGVTAAHKTLQSHVFQLRRALALGATGVTDTTPADAPSNGSTDGASIVTEERSGTRMPAAEFPSI